MSIEKFYTNYRMKLAPDLESPRDLEEYAGAYEGMSIDDACVSGSLDGLQLYFSVFHPHSHDDIVAFEDYLNRYYQSRH